jgi:hypothetical protein
MFRSIRVLALGGAAAAAAVLLSLPPVITPSPAAADEPVDVIAVNSKGTANNESKDQSRTVYTFPMYSLATGAEIGTITDDVGLTSTPGVVDVITTYRFKDGEIVNHMPVSISQDSQKAGWVVVGNRPEGNTIIKATGAYAGRTGRVRLSGVDDLNKFPAQIYQDDFWVIELDR